MPSCSVYLCSGRTTKEGENFDQFMFPENPYLKKIWVEQIDRYDFRIENVTRNSRVCERHFEKEHFVPDDENKTLRGKKKQKKSLNPEAYPTLFLNPKRQKITVEAMEKKQKAVVEGQVPLLQMGKKPDNPWLAENIQDFSFLNCPECNFKSKEENPFQDHAVKNHPLSSVFFCKIFQKEDEKSNNSEDSVLKEDIKRPKKVYKCTFCDFETKHEAGSTLKGVCTIGGKSNFKKCKIYLIF